MFAKLAQIRKAIAAFLLTAGPFWAIVAAADLETEAGLWSMLASLVGAVAVYRTPNKPPA